MNMFETQTIYKIQWHQIEQKNNRKYTSHPGCLLNYLSLTLLVLAILISATAKADDLFPAWSVKGFGSIGFARTNTDKLGFYRDRTQTRNANKSLEISTDSRLGIQLDVDINDSWHATTQFIVRNHAGNFFEQNLDLAYLRWYPNADTIVRAGRMGFDAFLLSDYRNVGYTYPWMRPPHEFYANIPITHYDGLDLTQNISLGDGYLSLKGYAGYTSTELSEEFLNLKLEGPIAGTNISYENGNWRIRAGYTFLRQLKEAKLQELVSQINDPENNVLFPGLSQLAPLLSIRDSNIHFMSLGTAYDDGIWLVHAEASYMDTQGQRIFNPDTASAYLSIGRRVSKVTLYSVYGFSHSFHKKTKVPRPLFPDPALIQSQQEIESRFNNQAINEHSLSLGLRWDFYPKFAFKLQWVHYWLTDNGVSLWHRTEAVNNPDNVDVMSFGIDFVF
jgi:hypothetical protein